MSTTPSPTWGTVIVVALVGVCLVVCGFLWWSLHRTETDLRETDRELRSSLNVEGTWRESMNSKLERLLTALEHTNCEDIEALKKTIEEIRAEIANERRRVREE